MKIWIWLFCQLSFLGLTAQVNKIEHFYVSSFQTERLYCIFRDTLHLPVAWKYENGGSYSSGGLSLGNVILEFSDHSPIDRTRYKGIGLEPAGFAKDLLPQLDAVKLAHDSIDPGQDYTIIMLNYLLPTIKLFVCEYTYHKEYDHYKQHLTDTLPILQQQGPGIIGLKELVVGCKNLDECRMELAKIPGIRQPEKQLFTFTSGPALRLTHADSIGITKIVILVRDREMARDWLRRKNILGQSAGELVALDPGLVDGLQVEFADR